MARRSRTQILILVLILAAAALTLRLVGHSLMDALVSMHGGGAGGH